MRKQFNVKDNYCGNEVDFEFANSGLSYSDRDNQIRVYKMAAEPSLTNEGLRQIVDVMLMSIHWQGYRVGSEEVLQAICAQHDGLPYASYVHKRSSHPVGNAHRRIIELFYQNREVIYIKFLQDQAARGRGGPHTVNVEGAASASSGQCFFAAC